MSSLVSSSYVPTILPSGRTPAPPRGSLRRISRKRRTESQPSEFENSCFSGCSRVKRSALATGLFGSVLCLVGGSFSICCTYPDASCSETARKSGIGLLSIGASGLLASVCFTWRACKEDTLDDKERKQPLLDLEKGPPPKDYA
jgi:hypothetical protein